MDNEGRIVLDGVHFRYCIVRSARRTRTALAITGPGKLTIRCPATAHIDAEAIIRRHSAWIAKRHRQAITDQRGRPVAAPEGWIWVLGERCPVPSQGLPPVLASVGSTGANSADDFRRALIQAYRTAAERHFSKRLAFWSTRLGIDYQGLRVSNAATRWGYCRQDGWIGLSWRLYQAPGWVVDYVVVHELCHRRHPHHQDSFWRAVAQAFPDFQAARRWLLRMGQNLMW